MDVCVVWWFVFLVHWCVFHWFVETLKLKEPRLFGFSLSLFISHTVFSFHLHLIWILPLFLGKQVMALWAEWAQICVRALVCVCVWSEGLSGSCSVVAAIPHLFIPCISRRWRRSERWKRVSVCDEWSDSESWRNFNPLLQLTGPV